MWKSISRISPFGHCIRNQILTAENYKLRKKVDEVNFGSFNFYVHWLMLLHATLLRTICFFDM